MPKREKGAFIEWWLSPPKLWGRIAEWTSFMFVGFVLFSYLRPAFMVVALTVTALPAARLVGRQFRPRSE
jgi:hypothetical protein